MMLLKEILDEPYDSNDFSHNKRSHTQADNTKLKLRGQGYYSLVYDIKDNPHEIVKITDRRYSNPILKYDGFNLYANAIVKNNRAASNPYLPRVRATHTSSDMLSFVVEKLHTFDEIFDDSEHSFDLLLSMCRKMFHDFDSFHKSFYPTFQTKSLV